MKRKNIISVLKNLPQKINKKTLLIILAVIVLGVGLYHFRSQFVVAIVNGRPISRLALIKEMEKQVGKQALNSLVTKTLILQEAKKQQVTITDEEIDQEIQKLEDNFTAQGQDFNQWLDLQGINRQDLSEQIKLQKIVETIAGKDIEITDQEVNDYLERNKDSLPQDLDSEEIRAGVRQQLKQQKLNEKIQLWLKSLYDQAKIHYLL